MWHGGKLIKRHETNLFGIVWRPTSVVYEAAFRELGAWDTLLFAEEKRWANCETTSISFPCLISANRFSTTKFANGFKSRLSCKSSEISSTTSVEESRSSVCIVNLISRAVSAEHTPSGLWRILSLACSPATCVTSTLQFSVKSLTSFRILAMASVGWNFFFWSFSFCTPKVSRNTNGSLGLVIILSLPTAVPQKSAVLSSVHSEVCCYKSALLLSGYPWIPVPAMHWTAFSVKENVFTVFEETSTKQGTLDFQEKWLHVLSRNHQCYLSVFSQAVHSRYMYYLRPHWRCGQFACNEIFLHSPYKMKQHRAYSVLVRPRKPMCDNQYYRKARLYLTHNCSLPVAGNANPWQKWPIVWELRNQSYFLLSLNYLSYPLSLKLFCQLSLIPKTPNRAS